MIDVELLNILSLRSVADTATGCHIWHGTVSPAGRAYLTYRRRGIAAARHLMIALYGELKTAQLVCHKCDNPLCVNPEHLYIGTSRENTQDMVTRKRGRYDLNPAIPKTHCVNGHAYTVENTYINSKGYSACRFCNSRQGRKEKILLQKAQKLAQ